MPEADPALLFLRPLETAGFLYMATGSFAAAIYGEPRMTHDVDIVLSLAPMEGGRLIELFPANDFYCPPAEVLEIETRRDAHGHANLIHHGTGFKADLYFMGEDPLHRWAMSHRRPMEIEGERVQLAPPEYVILRKMEFYREGKSQKHLRDIQAIIRCLPDLDAGLVEEFCRERGLRELWEAINKS